MRRTTRFVLSAVLVAGAAGLSAAPAHASKCSDPEAPECVCITVVVDGKPMGPCTFSELIHRPS